MSGFPRQRVAEIYLIVGKPTNCPIRPGMIAKDMIEVMLGKAWVSVRPIHCQSLRRDVVDRIYAAKTMSRYLSGLSVIKRPPFLPEPQYIPNSIVAVFESSA